MKAESPMSLLEAIETPADLRALPDSLMEPLAAELREYLLRSVASSGGHLAAGLGTVELTIALHRVLNTPDDRIVWDVGHQAYPHKILTERRTRMASIRKKGGLSGFPRRCESPYDAFGVAHAGTSISAAVGMAIAAAQEGRGRHVAAVIGDGAMTAGMAFEALDHAGGLNLDMLVVLNDNGMSISPNVGGLSDYLGRLATVRPANRSTGQDRAGDPTPTVVFRALGFDYVGPIDGHDLPVLLKTLRDLTARRGPRLLHVTTRKGKGYPPAEADPVTYHGVTAFDPARGLKSSPSGAAPPTYTDVFGDWLCDMAQADPRLIGITPAMREGSGLVRFAERYPERYFDVGIAEQHSVTLAAGLACEGRKPVVAIYSTFLQRAYDQLIHDVALQNLPVLLAIDRAGLVGPDGPTHAGSFDLTYLRCVPNLVVMAPADENECRQMLYTGFQQHGPCAVRYPRGRGTGVPIAREMTGLPLGKAQIRRSGRGVALLAFGAMVEPAMAAAEKVDATVVNMRFVKPLDESLVLEMAATHDLLVTVEDNVVAGGAGSAVNECLVSRGNPVPIVNLGLPDRFVDHGGREELLADCGLDSTAILRAINDHLKPARTARLQEA